VADSKHFGSPKVLQFGDKTGGERSGDSGHCAQCEAMLADALDGTLSAADQELFDKHVAECGPCSQLLADARRGAAFLEMLRTPAPEPPAALLERILAQTSGQTGQAVAIHPVAFPIPAQPAGQFGVAALTTGQGILGGAVYGNVVPLRHRVAAGFRASGLGQIMLQPRLAMTAAMAFFSVALTMNLMGIHPLSLRPRDLAPSSLKRDFYSTKASVVRNYESLRVVYELESRVHDLESAQDNDAPAPGSPNAPADTVQPGGQAPAAQPGATQQPGQQKAPPQPDSNQPAHKQPAPDPGTSRREEFQPSRRLMLASGGDGDTEYIASARAERILV
jgi:hypothetical protein